MRCRLVLFCVAGLLLAADSPSDQAVKDELAKLKGVWNVESYERDGQKTEVGAGVNNLTITDNKYTQRINGNVFEDGTIRLDPTKKPPTIDLAITSGQDKDKTQVGIYELKDDVWKLCLALPGEEKRPTEFDGSKFLLFNLKKEKAKDKK